ncbi:MAG: thioredoxin fold domain-containing protein [Gammaproteobacteria bacterium]|nr:thioredoxin fold domain-containing protein [Gammaproteobacteria bacterium]
MNHLYRFTTIFFLSLLSGLLSAAEENKLAEGMVNPGYHEPPSWFKSSFLDLQEDLAEANESKKRVILYFYQDGCPYCGKLLSVNWKQKDIVKKTRQNFDVIAINLWGDKEITGLDGLSMTEKKFAEKNRVMYTPTLLLLNEQGKVALRINGYYPPKKFSAALDYVAQKREKSIAFSDYHKDAASKGSNQKLYSSKQYLHKPYRLSAQSRGNSKPLLVLYEQRFCAHCDEIHKDIFSRPESKELLEKFDVVLLDRWGKSAVLTPKGKTTTELKWANQLKINYSPSLIFFDSKGDEVFRTEAYLKSFHIQSVMDYVSSGAYKTQPNLQRFIQARADALEAKGIHVDLMR